MPLPSEGPCEPWATWDEVTACAPEATVEKLNDIDEAAQDDIIAQVSEILYNLSGRRFPGVCEATRSPCVACTCRRLPCCCARSDRIDLGARWPVASVSTVVVDGVELSPGTDYVVLDWRWLVRTDGSRWPRCADDVDSTAFSVTWKYGRAVPPGGRRAAAVFALELARACVGKPCQLLPKQVREIRREGVTYALLDHTRLLSDGMTGIALIDMWLASLTWGDRTGAGMLDPARCESFSAFDTSSPPEAS